MILRCYYNDGSGTGVIVEGGIEEWDTLAAALNDLGPSGWEVAAPALEVPHSVNHQMAEYARGNEKIVDLILVNRTTISEHERKRQANILQRLLEKKEAAFAAEHNKCDTKSKKEEISRIKEEIRRLLDSGSVSGEAE